ncbi:hypothetical protein EON83_21305 [bacterium]|nr:MAG: hypothetical protein EON83_21305 [bacterium]
MKTILFLRSASLLGALAATATIVRAQPSLTVYNQNFAVVRDTIPLDLKVGVNRVVFPDTTASLEPDSVVLRDPAGKRQFQILEQSYRADPLSQSLLLSLYEGKTIDFRVTKGEKTEIVQGKIIRSGYVSPNTARGFGGDPYNGVSQPIVEVDGQLRFSLPGEPVFPALPSDAILKPTLNWVLRTDEGGPFKAELGYVTGGMTWKADYNLVAPENKIGVSDTLDLTGWVTFNNTSGKTFENARIKLMAGDVNKIDSNNGRGRGGGMMGGFGGMGAAMAPTVTEKTFDEYHLYTLSEPTTLRDRETKQVEFARAPGIKSQTLYIYDGASIPSGSYSYDGIRNDQNYGVTSHTKVMVMREFANTPENGLGIPLPKGRLRFYKRDADGQMEFIGENVIDHTPKGETVRVAMGNAFDLVGERKRTAYKIDSNYIDESFQITVRNHKAAPVEVRVVEHLYRGANWNITEKSNAFVKNEANTVEFRVQIPPDSEKVVTYKVHYTW